jgi:hypothetical protein
VGHGVKAGGHRLDAISVAHPHVQRAAQPGKQRLIGLVHIDAGHAILARLRRGHPAAQIVREQLHAVAQAQDRHPQVEQMLGQ